MNLSSKITLLRGEDLLRLRLLDGLLQKLLADLEFARARIRLRFLAKVAGFRVEKLSRRTWDICR